MIIFYMKYFFEKLKNHDKHVVHKNTSFIIKDDIEFF